MSKNINLAFMNAVHSVEPTIKVVFEALGGYTPIKGVPYVECFYMPFINNNKFVNNSDYEERGAFQITLRYPTGQGLSDILDRCDLYLNAFKVGTVLTNGDAIVRICGTPKVISLGTENDRIVYAITINYKCLLSVV